MVFTSMINGGRKEREQAGREGGMEGEREGEGGKVGGKKRRDGGRGPCILVC